MHKLFTITVLILTTLNITLIAQVNTERYREDEDSLGFSGFVDIEGILATGNTDFQLLSLGSRLNYNWGNDYTFLIGDGGYGWENGEEFVDQLFIHLRHVITTSELLQIEFFTQFDNNKKRLLLARELFGGGLRFKLLKSEHFKFRIGTAYMYEIEKYDLPENSVHPTKTSLHRFSSYATLQYSLNKTLSFISTTYYQPAFTELSDYKLFSENAIMIDAGRSFTFFIKFNLRFDSRPPDTVKDFDTYSRIGFSFKFGEG
jgi:putative salt-induced outer membrane protein YdiY